MKSLFIDHHFSGQEKEKLIQKVRLAHSDFELRSSEEDADLIISPITTIPIILLPGRYISPVCLDQMVKIHKDPFLYEPDFQILKNINLLGKKIAFIRSSLPELKQSEERIINELKIRAEAMGAIIQSDHYYADFIIKTERAIIAAHYNAPVISCLWIETLFNLNYYLPPDDFIFLEGQKHRTTTPKISKFAKPKKSKNFDEEDYEPDNVEKPKKSEKAEKNKISTKREKSSQSNKSEKSEKIDKTKSLLKKKKTAAEKLRETLKQQDIRSFAGGIKVAFNNSPALPPPVRSNAFPTDFTLFLDNSESESPAPGTEIKMSSPRVTEESSNNICLGLSNILSNLPNDSNCHSNSPSDQNFNPPINPSDLSSYYGLCSTIMMTNFTIEGRKTTEIKENEESEIPTNEWVSSTQSNDVNEDVPKNEIGYDI